MRNADSFCFSLAKADFWRQFRDISLTNTINIQGHTQMATTAQPTVTLKNLAADLAAKFDLPKKQVNQLTEELITLFVKNLKKGNRIRIAGFGIMQVKKRPARMGRNPATGEAIQIPAKKKIAFRPSKDLKEAVGK